MAKTLVSTQKIRFKTNLIVTALMTWMFLVLPLPIYSSALAYQYLSGTNPGSGNLEGFDITRTDSGYNTVGFWNNTDPNSKKAWEKTGYIGRLHYSGEPNSVFTVLNAGPTATNGANTNSFNWTLTSNNSNLGTQNWSEYFLVITPKGLTHQEKGPDGKMRGGTQDPFMNNLVISSPNQTFTIPRGAGEGEATVNGIGYNYAGVSGVYDGANEFRYKYQYRLIFIDVTMIHTNNNYGTLKSGGWFNPSYKPEKGYYETLLNFVDNAGSSVLLSLRGKNNPGNKDPQNLAAFFDVEQAFTSTVSYSTLETNHTSLAHALEVATIRYISHVEAGKITIASNAAATEWDFKFVSSSGSVIPHRLAYQGTIGKADELQRQEITSQKHTFKSVDSTKNPKFTIPTPLGDLADGHFLEGKVYLYLDLPDNPPIPGVYRTTIYIIFEKQ